MQKKSTKKNNCVKACIFFSLIIGSGITSHAQNMGVGTITPSMPLHVSSAADTALLELENRAALSTNTSAGIYLKNGNYFTGALKTNGSNSTTARLGLYTFADADHANLKERLSILNNGNIGINTIAPAATLDVNGTMRLQGNGAGIGKVLASDATGNATWKTVAIGFKAYPTNNISIPSGTTAISGYTEEFEDGGNNFDPVTGIYTVPSSGLYIFSSEIALLSVNTGSTIAFTLRLGILPAAGGSDNSQVNDIFPTITGYGKTITYTTPLKLLTGDQVHLETAHSFGSNLTVTGGFSTQTYFSCYKAY